METGGPQDRENGLRTAKSQSGEDVASTSGASRGPPPQPAGPCPPGLGGPPPPPPQGKAAGKGEEAPISSRSSASSRPATSGSRKMLEQLVQMAEGEKEQRRALAERLEGAMKEQREALQQHKKETRELAEELVESRSRRGEAQQQPDDRKKGSVYEVRTENGAVFLAPVQTAGDSQGSQSFPWPAGWRDELIASAPEARGAQEAPAAAMRTSEERCPLLGTGAGCQEDRGNACPRARLLLRGREVEVMRWMRTNPGAR